MNFFQYLIKIKNMFKYFTAEHGVKMVVFKGNVFPIIKNIYLLIDMWMAGVFKIKADVFVYSEQRFIGFAATAKIHQCSL